MTFYIKYYEGDDLCGYITLRDCMETFYYFKDHFSRDQYEQQWVSAIRITLEERRPTALFKSVEIGDAGVGVIWLYPIVPSEIAGNTDDKRLRFSCFPTPENAGVYIGECFMPVTVDVSNFERRIYMEFDDGSKGDELALYYLDLSAPERFFGYLDDNMADVYHSYFPNSDLEVFLSTR